MNDHYYAVIMAGGGGTRLWPLSRQNKPKQMLHLIGDRTLFQIAVQRLNGLVPPERTFVVTVAEQASVLQAQSPEIPSRNFLLEPAPKGTASVVGLAAVALAHLDPEAVMCVLTSDHIIQDEVRFRKHLSAAKEIADQRVLVTLGIQPTYPSTGYGYIHLGPSLGLTQGLEAFKVSRFIEKPDLPNAEAFLQSGEHVWNSGMFIWRVDSILAEFERQMPDLFQGLMQIAAVWGTTNAQQRVGKVWDSLRAETIDYGIMEGAEQVAVIPARGLGWSDVGSWESLFDVLPTDGAGNIFINPGEQLNLGARNSLFHLAEDKKLIVTIGVEDLVLVDTEDVLLVCRKDQAQQVREAVEKLGQTALKRYL